MVLKSSLFALLAASLSLFSPVKAASDVLELTAADFDETMKENPLVLAEFFAPWVYTPFKRHLLRVSVAIAKLWHQSMRKQRQN